MYCPKCGTQNPDNTELCVSCCHVLHGPAPAPAGETSPVTVKVSGLAITAFVLGILGIFTCGLTAIPAVIFGIIALAVIGRSGGRLTGSAFAVLGIVLPVFSIVTFALMMGILMPALARTRQLAFRMTCGTNLSGLGKAMLIYANDYDDELPRAGGRSTVWGAMGSGGWTAPSRQAAYNMAADGSGGTAGISSCFYLLVKYAEVTPKSFICKGDDGATEFMLSDYSSVVPRGCDLVDLWDFGPPADAPKHCSYSYHIPFGKYALTTSNEPGVAVAADRSPWIPSPARTLADATASWARFSPDIRGPGVSATRISDEARQGNAVTHQGDGQNVLFLDSHVEFAKRSFCGLENDNIYTISTLADRGDLHGTMPIVGPTCQPRNRRDSVLVDDPDSFATAAMRR